MTYSIVITERNCRALQKTEIHAQAVEREWIVALNLGLSKGTKVELILIKPNGQHGETVRQVLIP